MSKFIDSIDASGYLEVWKIYKNGSAELHFSDNNVITSGFGVALAYLFSGSGSTNILDYQPRWYQLGSGTPATINATLTELADPLPPESYTGVFYDTHYQIKNGSITDTETFGLISQHNVRKIGPNVVQIIIYVAEDAANGSTLKEIGLFLHNPTGYFLPASILMAYKQYSAIAKTSDYALLFKWQITI